MIQKVFHWIAFILMLVLDVTMLYYCISQMVLHPCFLDVKIMATFVMVCTLGLFTWFIYDISKTEM